MNRRTVIKNLALVIGGSALLPSCVKNGDGSFVKLKNLNLSGDQEQMISDICETIIPKTDVPGSKDLKLHLFVMKMLDDCYRKQDQQAVMKGMDEFSDMVQKKYGKSFSDLSVKDREAVLLSIEKNSNHPSGFKARQKQQKQDVQPIDAFYGAIKKETIFAYTTSKFFMTKEIVYVLVPGHYTVHYPVKNLKLT